jgi:hypothetical protein
MVEACGVTLVAMRALCVCTHGVCAVWVCMCVGVHVCVCAADSSSVVSV